MTVQIKRGVDAGSYLDKSHDQPRVNVPLDVAVEQPHPRVVAPEPHHDVPVRIDEQDVSAHGHLRQRDSPVQDGLGVIVSRVFVAPQDGLEVVAVQVERVLARVVVVEHDLDDLVVAQHERVGVLAVHGRVDGQVAGRERRVERGDFGRDVCDVVEEGIVLGDTHYRDQRGHSWSRRGEKQSRSKDGRLVLRAYHSVTQIVHHDVQLHDHIGFLKQLFAIGRDELHVVERVKFIDRLRLRERLGRVVHQPAGHIWIQAVGDLIEQVFIHGPDNGEVAIGVVTGGQEDAGSLGRGQVDHAGLGWLSVDAVDLDDAERVALDPEILRRKRRHVDDADEVRLARLHGDRLVLAIVHQRGLRHWHHLC